MNRLKQITTKAKALYKTGKFAKWTDAIKQASKSLGATKSGTHKDSKSHNVNIRVVSGTNQYKGIKNISVQKAREIASHWHGGQWSALYQFASSGVVTKENLNRYFSEINSDLNGASHKDKKELKSLELFFVKEETRLFGGKKFGAVKIIQKGETPKSKVTKVLQQVRTKKGTFKGYKKLSGMYELPPQDKTMYVRISPIAYVYANKVTYKGAPSLRDYLQKNVGEYVAVDTKFIFNNQYNTQTGFRLYDTMIDAIINDVRNNQKIIDKAFIEGDTIAFLDWKGIKPQIQNIPKEKFGSYYFESYPSLNYHRLYNSRQTINFIYYNGFYYQTNGIGYNKHKQIHGQWSGSIIPSDVKKKVDKLMKQYYS